MGKKILIYTLIFCMIISNLVPALGADLKPGVDNTFPLYTPEGKLVGDKDTRYITSFVQDENTGIITANIGLYNGGSNTLNIGAIGAPIYFTDRVTPVKKDGTVPYYGALALELDGLTYNDYYSTHTDLSIVQPFLMQNDADLKVIYISATTVIPSKSINIEPNQTVQVAQFYFKAVDQNDKLDSEMFYYKGFEQVRKYKISPLVLTGQCGFTASKDAYNTGEYHVISPTSFKMDIKHVKPSNLSANNKTRLIENYDENTMEWSLTESGPYSSGYPTITNDPTSIYVRLKADLEYVTSTDEGSAVYGKYKKYLAGDAVKIDFERGRETEEDMSIEKSSVNITAQQESRTTNKVGDILEYKIKASNEGQVGHTWKGTVLSDILPEGVDLVANSIKVNGSSLTYTYNESTRELKVTIGDVPAGQDSEVTFQVQINEKAYDKTVLNSAKVIGKDNSGKEIEKETEETDGGKKVEPKDPKEDMYVEKTSENKTALQEGRTTNKVNDTLQYKIVAGNRGTTGSKWNNAVIKDILPEGVTFVEGSVKLNGATKNYTYNSTTRELQVELGNIAAGTSINVTFDVTIDADAYEKIIVNSVKVTGTDNNGNEIEKETEETGGGNKVDPKESHEDMSIEKSSINKTAIADGRTTNKVGDNLEYKVTARNEGDTSNTWKGTILTDILPEGLTLVANSIKINGSNSSYSYNESTRELKVTIGDIAPGEQVELIFEATINTDAYGKTIINSAKVTGKDNSGKEIEKETEETDGGKIVQPKEPKEDMYVEKTSENKTAKQEGRTTNKVKDTLVYKIVAGNKGQTGSKWNGAVITDILPDGVTFVEGSVKLNGSTIGYNYNSATRELTVQIGNIAAGDKAEVTFETTIDANAYEKTIVNSVKVNGKDDNGKEIEKETEESGGGNKVDPKESHEDMSIEKSSVNLTAQNEGRTTNKVGDKLQYKIVAKNEGTTSNTWRTTILTDILPEEITLVANSVKLNGSSLSYSYNETTRELKVTIGNIAAGSESEVIFEATINTNAYEKTIKNSAKVNGKDNSGKEIEKETEEKDGKEVDKKDPKEDMYIEKTSENKTAKEEGRTTNKVKDTIEYKIVAGNKGQTGSKWSDVVIKDILPDEVTLVKDSVKLNGANVNYEYNETTRELKVGVGNIAAGDKITVTFDATINEKAYEKTILNSVKVNGEDDNGNEIEKETEESGGGNKVDPKEPKDDMYTIKTSKNITAEAAGRTENKVKDTLVYTIKVGNEGETKNTWRNVIVEDVLPEEVDLVATTVKINGKNSTYEYNETTRVLTIKLGNVLQGEEQEITFEAKINSKAYGKTVINGAKATGTDNKGNTIEKETTEDGGNYVVPKTPEEDMYVVKTSENLTAKEEKRDTNKVGDTLLYTITAGNEGESGSTWRDVIVTDTLPEEVDLVPNSAKVNGVTAYYTYDEATREMVLSVGNILAGDKVVITFESIINEKAYEKTVINKIAVKGKDDNGKEIEKEKEESGGGKEVEKLVTRKVTGNVFPVVPEDKYLGPQFAIDLGTVVELRATYLTPATGNLSVLAKSLSNVGDGEFTFEEVPIGEYVLYIKRPGYLTRAMNVSIKESDPAHVELTPPGSDTQFKLWAGDVNENGVIEAFDIQVIVDKGYAEYGDGRYLPSCDLNGDGVIDAKDIQAAVANGGKTDYDYEGASDVDFNK